MIRMILSAGVLAAVVVATAPSFAQSPEHSGHKGATGWSGGARDDEQNGAMAGRSAAPDDASDQAPIATGADLKGPPAQLPPNKTPE